MSGLAYSGSKWGLGGKSWKAPSTEERVRDIVAQETLEQGHRAIKDIQHQERVLAATREMERKAIIANERALGHELGSRVTGLHRARSLGSLHSPAGILASPLMGGGRVSPRMGMISSPGMGGYGSPHIGAMRSPHSPGLHPHSPMSYGSVGMRSPAAAMENLALREQNRALEHEIRHTRLEEIRAKRQELEAEAIGRARTKSMLAHERANLAAMNGAMLGTPGMLGVGHGLGVGVGSISPGMSYGGAGLRRVRSFSGLRRAPSPIYNGLATPRLGAMGIGKPTTIVHNHNNYTISPSGRPLDFAGGLAPGHSPRMTYHGHSPRMGHLGNSPRMRGVDIHVDGKGMYGTPAMNGIGGGDFLGGHHHGLNYGLSGHHGGMEGELYENSPFKCTDQEFSDDGRQVGESSLPLQTSQSPLVIPTRLDPPDEILLVPCSPALIPFFRRLLQVSNLGLVEGVSTPGEEDFMIDSSVGQMIERAKSVSCMYPYKGFSFNLSSDEATLFLRMLGANGVLGMRMEVDGYGGLIARGQAVILG